jgi:hypothetical protein
MHKVRNLLALSLFTFASAILICGCGQIRTGTPKSPGFKFSGFWLSKIPQMSRVMPVGDGRHAWGWSELGRPRGLYLVDSAEPSSPRSIEGLATVQVESVWPAGDSQNAWVLCNAEGSLELYLVSVDGTFRKLKLPSSAGLSNPVISQEMPGPYVWIAPFSTPFSFQRAGTLFVARANGKVSRVSDVAAKSTGLRYDHNFHPIGDGSRALVSNEARTAWFLVGEDGTDRPIKSPLLTNRLVSSGGPVQGSDLTVLSLSLGSGNILATEVLAIFDREGNGHVVPMTAAEFFSYTYSPNRNFVWIGSQVCAPVQN